MRKKLFKGYILHNKRLVYTGKAAIRSIKYPLVAPNKTALNNLSEKIIYDYEHLFGPLNVASYARNSNRYSLVDFWIDSLRAGVIWQSKSTSLIDLISKLEGSKSPSEKIFEQIDFELKNKLDKEQFKDIILLNTGIRSSSNVRSLRGRFLKCFKEEFRDTEEVIACVDKWSKDLIVEGKSILVSKQFLYWEEEFGIKIFPHFKDNHDLPKLTFFVEPSLEFSPHLPLANCLERLKKFDISRESLLGLDNNFSAFSNYFNELFNLLFRGEIKKIVTAVLAVSKSWENEPELEKRLHFLSEKAKLLGYPKLTSSWADYRMIIGGKIKSWHSNYTEQLIKVREDLKKHQIALDKLQEDLKKVVDSSLREQIEAQREALLPLLDTMLKEKDFSDDLELYRFILSDFKSLLNGSYQRYIQTEEERKEDRDVTKKYKDLYSNLRNIPRFFGESKKEQFNKFINKSLPTIDVGLKILEDIRNALETVSVRKPPSITEEYVTKQLEKLSRKYKINAFNSNRFKQITEQVLRKYNNGELPKISEVFYRYPRESHVAIRILPVKISNPRKDISYLLDKYQISPDWKNSNPGEVVDLIEIYKLTLGWLLSCNKDFSMDFSSYDLKLFPEAASLIKNFGSCLSGYYLSKMIFNCITSEIKGMITLYTRDKFVVRYVTQMIGSNQKFPLLCLVGEKQTKNFSRNWGVLIEEKGDLGEEKNQEKCLIFKDKTDFAKAKEVEIFKNNIWRIRTSKYQIQFLNRLFKKTKEWDLMNLVLSEPSLVLEEEWGVSWDKDKLLPLLKKEKSCEERLYYSLPLNLVPATDYKEQSAEIEQRNTYLGLDVGEFGVAYAVVRIVRDRIELLSWGFLKDPALRKIRERVQDMKKKQVMAVFSSSSTAVARVREMAIHSLRNQIHSIALAYKAKIIYEISISNFETGGNRMAKIYRSIKVSDVYRESGADTLVSEMIWGKKNKQMGNHISSYATSYTCCNCARTPFELVIDNDKEYEKGGDEFIFNVGDEKKVRGFLQKSLLGKTIKGKEVLKSIKEYARPPIREVLLEGEDVEQLLKRRGNSYIYRCPFCGYKTDADIQAALNIACRGYISDNAKDAVKEGERKLDYILEVRKLWEKNGAVLRSAKFL